MSSAYTMGLQLYIVIDEDNIQVLMLMKILGGVQKRARKELKAFPGRCCSDSLDMLTCEMDLRYSWDRLDRWTW